MKYFNISTGFMFVGFKKIEAASNKIKMSCNLFWS